MSVLGLRSLSNELRSQSFKIEKVRKENFGAVKPTSPTAGPRSSRFRVIGLHVSWIRKSRACHLTLQKGNVTLSRRQVWPSSRQGSSSSNR
jgi:hypothetical protein